jgi:hypothetical protein
MPRVALRWGLVQNSALRRWLAGASGMPMPAVAARFSVPIARYYAHVIGANEAAAHCAVRDLPRMLDRADALLAQGLLTLEPPNAATLQIFASVRALEAFLDLQDLVAARPSAMAARELFPHFPEPVPHFIPRAWLPDSPGQG